MKNQNDFQTPAAWAIVGDKGVVAVFLEQVKAAEAMVRYKNLPSRYIAPLFLHPPSYKKIS